MSEAGATNPFSVLIEYQVRTENCSADEWLSVWNERGEDARLYEPQTGAYVAAINAADESSVLVFERYENTASLEAHIDRPAHAALMEAMGSRKMTKRRVMSTRFSDVDHFGWWSRPGTVDAAHQGAVLVALGFRFGSPSDQAEYIGLAQQHAEYCREAEPETLIYSAGIALGDADREIDLTTGDLVFVMACTDMAAVEKHANDPQHLAAVAKMEELDVERTFLRTYKTTGHGFLWRD